MRCQDLRVVQLEQLRRSLRTEERRWLRQVLQNKPEKEVRELAQAAGLQTMHKDGNNNSCVAVGELRAALLEHMFPEQPAAPEEMAFGFGLFLVIASHDVFVRMSGPPMRSSARPGNGLLQILPLQRPRK